MKLKRFWQPLVVLSVAAGAPGALAADPQVDLKTNLGTIRLELYPAKAPKTVENFLQYVKDGHFAGTIFHRVIDGFMIQGGGFDKSYKQKPTRAPIENEAKNGLKNDLGTIAMARTSAALRLRPVLHQRQEQRFPEQRQRAGRLGLHGVRQGGLRYGRRDQDLQDADRSRRSLPHRCAARDGGHRIRHRGGRQEVT
jgi:hypothetical protein